MNYSFLDVAQHEECLAHTNQRPAAVLRIPDFCEQFQGLLLSRNRGAEVALPHQMISHVTMYMCQCPQVMILFRMPFEGLKLCQCLFDVLWMDMRMKDMFSEVPRRRASGQ